MKKGVNLCVCGLCELVLSEINRESADSPITGSSANGSADEDNFTSYTDMTVGEGSHITKQRDFSDWNNLQHFGHPCCLTESTAAPNLHRHFTDQFIIFDLIICVVYVPMYIYDINYGSDALFDNVRSRMGFALFIGSLKVK